MLVLFHFFMLFRSFVSQLLSVFCILLFYGWVCCLGLAWPGLGFVVIIIVTVTVIVVALSTSCYYCCFCNWCPRFGHDAS